ncbi:hypothetical protein BDV26DRAFT_273407 [Aspergillus bertholletiae]|uniref:Uncharacterized protein n=1 Tax=Aspergillus bertholletiae TaxID=1226010 RepID=A0A5N7ASH0_9EURO|nr:hypothetical protein BDV26DRAFT_273407 [Aspergillus bertholletiae]
MATVLTDGGTHFPELPSPNDPALRDILECESVFRRIAGKVKRSSRKVSGLVAVIVGRQSTLAFLLHCTIIVSFE